MSQETAFNEEIARIASDVLASGEIEKIMQEKIRKGFEDAIDSAFRWGELNRAIETRVKEVLVPYVERYDMNRYVVKLDEILSQIVEQSAVADNKKMLENFKNLMVSPVEGTIKLEDLFGRYCQFVAKNVDVSELEVDTDDEPTYEYVTALAEVVDDEEPRFFKSQFKHASLYLHVEDSEDLCFNIRLSKWEHDYEDGFDVRYDAEPTIPGLSRMSDFEVFLCALQQARVKLICDERQLEEFVTPDQKPEVCFQ